MKIRFVAAPVAAAASLFFATSVSSYDSAGQAAAAGAKICAAASKDFPLRELIAVKDLKTRLAALGAKLDGENLKSVDSSCDMMGLAGMGGFGTMPVLNLGSNKGQDVTMSLMIKSRNGECVAAIISLDGC